MKKTPIQTIQELLALSISDVFQVEVLPEAIKIEHPAEEAKGEYSSNVALVLAAKLKQKPIEIAQKIAERINIPHPALSFTPSAEASEVKQERGSQVGEIVSSVEVAPPGFLNFRLKSSFLVEMADGIVHQSSGPLTAIWQGKKIMVEFAHPNTHKEFHIGHLRNIAIGESLVRILEANGAEVFRANYEGDVGLHVAKAIWGIYRKLNMLHSTSSWLVQDRNKSKLLSDSGQAGMTSNQDALRKVTKDMTPAQRAEFLGQGYALGSKRYEEDEQAKKEIIDLNKSIYKDPASVVLWKETRQMSLDYFDTVYSRLYTHFDRFFFESEVASKGRQLVIDGIEKGVFVRDTDGSIYFPGEKVGLNNCVFVTREDYATYEGKDIAVEDLEYQTFAYDVDIHVVANEQTNFFQIAFAALEQLFPYQKGKQYHLVHGMVKLKSGKMSSRTGEVITADELVDQVKEKIREIIRTAKEQSGGPQSKETEEVVEKVAVAAVKYAMLRVNPKQDIAFDLESSISLDGDSGPYLLYTYARCKSVLRKNTRHSEERSDEESRRDPCLRRQASLPLRMTNVNEEELSLLRFFIRFPEVVGEAGKMYAPNVLTTYLFDVAQRYNGFYNKHTILGGANEEEKQLRLWLTQTTARILKQGLLLLGIETVERM